ncbi:heme A synthase [Alicyclobacillus cycloheptanicus]|uniref:Cytochrome c oxidase assembly protein subunit 15 n=1 Tax=Alicyclobacillus cycloheptanicus TaxID=1457 RepID=A0ABT9XHY5_9BACL|nr:COX15/CtaA family protein [Alicyclobacillus cycloheptanicus]MDQ0189725.1 cytochrome c oxidase assembly protein subunit 15 [Alicyclobacillus cycloheptanicus]WDM01937.1 heme A synthase [Alicyclobacillus cycloheptanicus]
MPANQTSPWVRRAISILAILTLIGFFAVNTMGFVDTETGSAFGCGHQWPLCNGAVIPSHWGLKTLIEFSHRGLVGAATLLLFALCALVWWQYRRWLEVRVLVMLSIAFVFLEAALGALGVKFSDPPFELAFHFGISLLAFNSILLLVVVIRYINRALRLQPEAPVLRAQTPVSLRVWTFITLVYTYIAMYIGAYVASTGYGHLFRGWPLPTETRQVQAALTVDWLHRSVAMGLVLLTLYLCIASAKIRQARPDLFFGSLVSLVLVCIQAVTGALLIATNIALFAFLLHVSVVTFLFAAVCYLALQTLPEPRRAFLERRSSSHHGADAVDAQGPRTDHEADDTPEYLLPN